MTAVDRRGNVDRVVQLVQEEYKLIKAKKSKLSRAKRNRIIHIVELNGGIT